MPWQEYSAVVCSYSSAPAAAWPSEPPSQTNRVSWIAAFEHQLEELDTFGKIFPQIAFNFEVIFGFTTLSHGKRAIYKTATHVFLLSCVVFLAPAPRNIYLRGVCQVNREK